MKKKIEVDRRLYDTINELANMMNCSIEEALEQAVLRELRYRNIFSQKKEIIARATGMKLAWPELQRFIDHLMVLERDERLTTLGVLHFILGADMPNDVDMLMEVAKRGLQKGKEEIERFEV